MKDLLLVKPRFFYLLFIPYLIVGALAMASTNQPDLFLYLNKYNSTVADFFFFWITDLGNGLFFIIVCLLVLVWNVGDGILGAIIFTLSALVPQFLKKVVFTGAIRPVKYFEGYDGVHLVQGVNHHFYHSFPSGHSVSIFALALFLTMVVKNKAWGLVFAAIAIITAYSRVYLAQHFFVDIYVGSCIGFVCAILVYLIFEKLIKRNKNFNKGLFGFGTR